MLQSEQAIAVAEPAEKLQDACGICGGAFASSLTAEERMFGYGGAFHYGQCANCKALTLRNTPGDLGRFYPAGKYYSFSGEVYDWPKAPAALRTRLGYARNEHCLFGRNLLGAIVRMGKAGPGLDGLKDYLWGMPTKSFRAKILDVGCGGGAWLRLLAHLGFVNLHGIDPFLDAEVSMPPLVEIRRASLETYADSGFDFINLSHSLEHMPDHRGALARIRELLKPGGVCRIEIPVCDSDAFEKYRERWIELDAPRHLTLHTDRSMEIVAGQAGLKIERIVQTGWGLENWGSELYRRGLTYFDFEREKLRNPADVFTADEVAAFNAGAGASEKRGKSGRRAYYLRAKKGT